MTTKFVIKAYPYVPYQADDNIQAFFTAYNDYVQEYINTFNDVNLPIYTNLSGTLLDWVAQGLYGISRPALPSTGSAERGPYDSMPYNFMAYNRRIPARDTTYFATSDDIFKRIITWSFYKGDQLYAITNNSIEPELFTRTFVTSKAFTIRWLKRRVARFLYGHNGTDYSGPTYDISVAFTGPYAVTITVPNNTIGNIFHAAIYAGILPMPFQLVVTVVP